MALAIDASTPALVSGTASAISTAATSYPANTFFLVGVGRNGPNSTDDDTGTVSGAGLTWTLAGRKSVVGATGQITGGSAQPGCFEWWVAYSTSALTSVTITDTRSAASGTGNEHAMQVIAITGAENPWAGAIAANAIAAGTPSKAIVTTAANSWAFAGNTDWAAKGNATVGSGQTLVSQYHLAGQISIHFWRQTSTTATSGTSVTMNLTAPTLEQYNMLAIEVRESGGGGGSAFSGSVSLSGSGTLSFAGTPGETGSAALSGSGSLSLSGAPSVPGTAALSGSGSLSFSATPAIPGAVALSGSGTLSLIGALVSVGSISLSGSGTLTTSGVPRPTGTAALSGSGALSLGGIPTILGTVATSGSGTLTLSGVPSGGGPQNFSGLVMLTGSGSLTFGDGTPSFSDVVQLSGTGVLTVNHRSEMYLFVPPGEDRVMDPTGQDFLWSKVHYIQGNAVIKTISGGYRMVQVHDPDEPDIDIVYLGGHEYTVTDVEAANLIAAGYAANLTVVT